MRILLYTTLAIFTVVSCSHKHHMDHKMENMSFQEAKDMKLEMLGRKEKMISSTRSCINASQTKDDLKQCKEKMYESKKAMKKDMKEKMKKKDT